MRLSESSPSPSDKVADMAEVNRAYYDSPGIAAGYATRDWLFKAEEVILARVRPELSGGRLLDIGVGGGRTTPHLRALVASYVGIDFSVEMLEQARSRFPDADLRFGDARRLESFSAGAFDAVCMSYGAIGDMNAQDRRRVLKEVYRVLRPGGIFFFSADDLTTALREEGEGAPEAGGAVLVVASDEALGGEVLPTFHVSRRAQVAQLAELGFGAVEIVSPSGELVEAEGERHAAWFYYLARKL
jgi:SAM-dependent methyltransferase